MNKHIFRFTILLFIASTFWSCGSSEKKAISGENIVKNYIAEIADSVVFDRFSVVDLEALNPETNELLLFDDQKRQMLVIDSEGNLVSSFNPFVEGPNYMGERSFGWTFYGEDQMVGFGYTHFNLFSKVGKRLQRMEYPIDVGGWTTMNYGRKRIIGYEKNGEASAIALIVGHRGISERTQSYQDTMDVVFNLDFEKNETRPIFRKPEPSVYRTGGKYLGSGYPLMDHLGEGEFVVGYEADKNIYVMNALTNALEQTIILPEAYWPIANPVDFGKKGAPDLRRVVGGVYRLKDQFLVKIFGLIPRAEFQLVQKLPRWWESPELRQFEKKYNTLDILLLNRDGFLGRVEWNLGQIDYRYFGDKDGFIWVKRVYEDERDYQTFLKIRIVPKEKGLGQGQTK